MNVMIWLVILVALLGIEAATAGLTTIWFAGGALCAALFAYLGFGIVPQLLIFSAVSAVLLVFTRPLAVKSLRGRPSKTNVDTLPGKRVVVTQSIDNLGQTGQVRLNDVEWTARAEADGDRIPKNAIVEIVAVEGVKLIVKPIGESKN